MAKQIQSFEAWGYVVEPNAKGFKNVKFPANEKHCNIYHPDAVDSMLPINTFTITGNKSLLKIPRAFNHSQDFDRRPRQHKMNFRDQIVSYWTLVERRDLKDLGKLMYTVVIERSLRDLMEEVYETKGLDAYSQLTLLPGDPDFQLLLASTPFLAGAEKMLEEYADRFAGKRIRSCTFDPICGFTLFDFTITLM